MKIKFEKKTASTGSSITLYLIFCFSPIESTPKLIHVCPEQYQGTLSGYPLYKSGFVTVENCDQEKTKFDASKIVTIVYNFVNVEHVLSEDQVTQIIDQTIYVSAIWLRVSMFHWSTIEYYNRQSIHGTIHEVIQNQKS